MPPMKKRVVIVEELVMNQVANKYSLIDDPLHIELNYTVAEPITDPRWAVTYVADIAYNCVSKPLVSPSSSLVKSSQCLNHTPPDAVILNVKEMYKLELQLPVMDLSTIEEQYLLQIGAIRFELYSKENIVDDVSLIVQTKRNDKGEMMRMIMSPLV